jgi:hypothetical protein
VHARTVCLSYNFSTKYRGILVKKSILVSIAIECIGDEPFWHGGICFAVYGIIGDHNISTVAGVNFTVYTIKGA